LGIANVAGLRQNLNFCRCEFAAAAVQSSFIAARDNQIAICGGQSAGDSQSNTAGGTGDESDLVLQ